MKQIKEKLRIDMRDKLPLFFTRFIGKDLSATVKRFYDNEASLIMSFEGDPVIESFDEGETWQHYGGRRTWPKSTLGMFWVGNQLIAFWGGHQLWRSLDGGIKWSEVENIPTADDVHFKGIGRPNIFSIIVTAQDTIVMVADNWLGQEGPDGQLLCSIISFDAGKTWTVSRLFGPPSPLPPGPEGFGEPSVVQLPSGWLWMVFRTLYGELWQCISRDQGRTWGDATPTGLISPIANCSAQRAPNGATVLCWNSVHPQGCGNTDSRAGFYHPRTNLVFAVSHDNCRRWTCPVVVEEKIGVYPSIYFKGDTMYILYQSATEGVPRGWGDYGLTLVTYDLEEVMNLPAWTSKTIQPYIDKGLVAPWLALACDHPPRETIS